MSMNYVLFGTPKAPSRASTQRALIILPENLLKLSLPKELFKRMERTTTERMRILTESSFIVFLHTLVSRKQRICNPWGVLSGGNTFMDPEDCYLGGIMH